MLGHLIHVRLKKFLRFCAHDLFAVLGLYFVPLHRRRPLAKIGGHLADLDVELDVPVLLLANHQAVVQVEVDQNYNVVVRRLKEGVFDVVIENLDPFTTARSVEKPILVRFKVALHPLLFGRRPHKQVCECRGVGALWVHLEGVLLDKVLPLFRILEAGPVLLEHLLDLALSIGQPGNLHRPKRDLLQVNEPLATRQVLGLLRGDARDVKIDSER
mmetsp:Transcript_15432/g.39868  ORF Transcript_15432/g.39868 Transcript_15432/m.39868 type:complete len:215 (-) Transcript_15432:1752-2396(-)